MLCTDVATPTGARLKGHVAGESKALRFLTGAVRISVVPSLGASGLHRSARPPSITSTAPVTYALAALAR